MKIWEVLKLDWKKLNRYRGKSAFLVLPIVVLVMLSVVLVSQSNNILAAAGQSIFGTFNEQSKIIELSKQSAFSSGGPGGGTFSVSFGGKTEDTNYVELDEQKIGNVEGVSSTQILSPLPVSNARTTDLVEGKEVSLPSLTGLEADFADKYTNQDFDYTEGETIPIIINANSLMEQYQDWKGKDEIEIKFGSQIRGGKLDLETSDFPIKSRSLDYTKEQLLGKEFTMTVGGLDPIQDYKVEPTTDGTKYTKLTADQVAAKETARQTALSPYWNYDSIKAPLTYKFKIVGVVEDDKDFNSYLPSAFADKLMQDYLQHEIDARTSKEMAKSDLNSLFTGLTFDGVELKAGFGGFGSFGGGKAVMIGRVGSPDAEETEAYAIPGLVIKTDRSTGTSNNPFDSGDVTGEYKDATAYAQSSHYGSQLLVKIDDYKLRGQVVKALNDLGYAFQDFTKSGVYDQLRSTLQTLTIVFTVLFIALSVAAIIIAMGKFVSEGKKEIGIWRALGATRGLVARIYLLQAVLAGVVAYAIGIGLGLALNLALSVPLHGWFVSFINSTLGQTTGSISLPTAQAFTGVEWTGIAIFSGLLLIIVLVAAIVPARQAARLSPVQAIRGE